MREVQFVEFRRERPNLTDSAAKTHVFVNKTEADIAKVVKETLYIVVADCWGLNYIFDVSKLAKKYMSGKTWTPKMLSNISASLERKELFLDDVGELSDMDKVFKKVAAETGY